MKEFIVITIAIIMVIIRKKKTTKTIRTDRLEKGEPNKDFLLSMMMIKNILVTTK